jgi:hypothetical protein
MAFTSVQLTFEVEKAIRSLLTKLRAAEHEKREVSMLTLYTLMEKQFAGQTLTVGFFNKIVGDMRRAGIITITKFRTSELVCLSDDAWRMYGKLEGNGEAGA